MAVYHKPNALLSYSLENSKMKPFDYVKMKPFNLEAALAGAPVVTRDGRPVKIAGYNPDAHASGTLTGWIEKSIAGWNKKGGGGLK